MSRLSAVGISGLQAGEDVKGFSPPAQAGFWDNIVDFFTPLEKLMHIFAGPVAYTCALLGMIVAGISLIFGGELSDFARRLFTLTVVISGTLFVVPLMQTFFGVVFAGAGDNVATLSQVLHSESPTTGSRSRGVRPRTGPA